MTTNDVWNTHHLPSPIHSHWHTSFHDLLFHNDRLSIEAVERIITLLFKTLFYANV